MDPTQMNCPMPISSHPNVLLSHGSGGKLMHQLINDIFAKAFKNPLLDSKHDGAVFAVDGKRFAFTTDSYVVQPLFFSGGDIGSMAVYGTVNDLAMCGAVPKYLSAGFIIEEGFSIETLRKISESMKRAAERVGVQIVTGDTKVVERGKGDGVFINTAGIGIIEHALTIAPSSVAVGDQIILSGDVGRHGIAVMSSRDGLQFEAAIQSDLAPVCGPVKRLLDAGVSVHCLRDLTRGGLATALVEIANTAKFKIEISETSVPVREEVKGACELLGLDPMYVANEGRFIAFVPACDSQRALQILKNNPVSAGAQLIGKVTESHSSGRVVVRSELGTHRILDMLSGDQLPRIC